MKLFPPSIFLVLSLLICSCKPAAEQISPAPPTEEDSGIDFVDHSETNRLRMDMVKNGLLVPSTEIHDIKGQTLNLHSKKGKFIVLNIWASWCTPCVEYMPEYQALMNDPEQSNIEYTAISIDDEQSYWQAFCEEHGWTENSFWLGMKEKEPLFAFSYSDIETEDFKGILVAMPKYVIISPDGVILNNNAANPSTRAFQEEINRYINNS